MALLILAHPLQIGSILQSSFAVFYYWIFICLLFIVIFGVKILDFLCLSYSKYKLIELKDYPGDIFTLKYQPLIKNKIIIKPGQYFYIKTGIFSEAHPFSVLEYSEETGEIIFGIKKLGRFSKHLGNSKTNSIHYIDGPFGEFTFEGHNQDPKIILAGGIGITPFYEVVLRYGTKDTYLFYANKSLEFALYRERFKKLLNNNYFDFVDIPVNPEENVFCEVISAGKIQKILNGKNLNEFKFFICGSPGFTNAMISCILSLGVPKKHIYIEEFEY
jgi:predicted ferric reductase